MTSDINQLLIDYGLTINQSKVFSVLTECRQGVTAKEISKVAGLARQSVYTNLLDLIKMGLVEKIIDSPKKYYAIPIKRALNILHDQKKMQIHKLESLTTEVLSKYNNKNLKNYVTKEGYQFILIPKKNQLETSISHKISNSRKSVKIITSWKTYIRSLIVFEKTLKKALENNVIFQVLVSETPKDHKVTDTEKFFHHHPNAFIKFVESSIKTSEIIIDDEEIFLITEPKAGILESPAVWSNNVSLVTALLACFDLFSKKVHS